MDTLSAFLMNQINQGKEPMVFDWDKAAEIIKDKKPATACAGLRDDWEWTGGVIYTDDEPVFDDYTYLQSNWATPELEIDGTIIECYRFKSEVPEWDESTKWPESSLKILNGADNG